MEENEKTKQEMFYETLNKATSAALKIIKWAIYPLTLLFIIVLFVWGININNLNNELTDIKSSLDIRIKEIDIKQKEVTLFMNENLFNMKKKKETIDTTFGKLRKEYEATLNRSNTELNNLKQTSRSANEYSKSIEKAINTSISDFKEAKIKYNKEIEYASKGADMRKNDIEKIFQDSKVLLSILTDIIENTNRYIEAMVAGALLTENYNEGKVKNLKEQLDKQLLNLKQQLQTK